MPGEARIGQVPISEKEGRHCDISSGGEGDRGDMGGTPSLCVFCTQEAPEKTMQTPKKPIRVEGFLGFPGGTTSVPEQEWLVGGPSRPMCQILRAVGCHRSHFGSRYNMGCCGFASLFCCPGLSGRFDSG